MNSEDKLTEKEEETMLLLWEHGPCQVKDLVQYYDEPRPHINTVSTFVRSLKPKDSSDTNRAATDPTATMPSENVTITSVAP